MQNIFSIDPKLLKKASPRPKTRTAVDVVGSSLLTFEGIEVFSGRVSSMLSVPNGYFETYRHLIYVGAATETLSHPQLGCAFAVLEGSGTLIRDGQKTLLSIGATALIEPGMEYQLFTDKSYLLIAVVQPKYYALELKIVAPTAREGRLPMSPPGTPKRHQSKAVEQLQAMAKDVPVRNVVPPAGEEDFDPLDPSLHTVNPRSPRF